MTIKLPSGPARGMQVVERAVNDLMPDRVAALSAAGSGAAPQASQPIQRFLVKLSDLTDVHFLDQAVPIGWRYLILGPDPVAIADVKEPTAGAPSFDSLIRGAFASRLAAAAEFAAQRYGAHPNEFDVRVLEIPSIYLSALWLHGPRDIFIPLTDGDPNDPSPPGEDPAFILRAVQAAAAKRSQSHEGEDMPEADNPALQQAIDVLIKTAVQLNETTRQLTQMKPAALAAPGGAAGGGQGATTIQLTSDQRTICECVINAFETGSMQGDYSNITIFHDGPGFIRQITYGRAQTTEYSHLQELVKMYVDAGGQFSDDLRPFVEKIGVVALVDDAHFKDLLHRAGAQDPVMRKTQDVFFDRAYFQPALNWAQTNGFSRALSMLVIYDSQIQSGGILRLLRARFPEPIPARGGNEQTWIQQYVSVRNDWLANNANPIVRSTTYRTRDLAREIARGNWDLAMTPISANGVQVVARPLALAGGGGPPPSVPYVGQIGATFGDDDPAAPFPGEVDDVAKGSDLANFGDSSVLDLAPLGGAPGAATRLALDMNRVWAFLKSCETSSPRVTYGLGAKVPFLTAVPGRDFTKVDCSGFVREAIRLATTPTMAFPDGSVNQHDWIRAHGFATSSPAAATQSDGLVRIAFLRPQDTRSHIGHVLLISGGKTIESHGGVGPDSRAWTGAGFQGLMFVYVLAPDTTAAAGGGGPALQLAASTPGYAVQTGPRFWGRTA